MATVLLMLPNLNFRDEEYHELVSSLTEQGHQLLIAALERGEAIGMIAERVTVERTFDQVNIDACDAVIVIGGIGARQLLYDSTLSQLLIDAVSSGKVVGSIGMGVLVLAQAGILKGKRATGAIEDALALHQRGVDYQRQSVVVDGQLITAQGHEYILDFVNQLLSML